MENRLVVFISSSIKEFSQERVAVKETIEAIPLTKPWVFEYTPASTEEVEDSYLRWVRECDIFVMLLGNRVPEAVRREYQEALAHEKPTLVFVKKGRKDEQTQAFVERIKVKYTEFTTVDDLQTKVRQAVLDELIHRFRRYGLSEKDQEKMSALSRQFNIINSGGGDIAGRDVIKWNSSSIAIVAIVAIVALVVLGSNLRWSLAERPKGPVETATFPATDTIAPLATIIPTATSTPIPTRALIPTRTPTPPAPVGPITIRTLNFTVVRAQFEPGATPTPIPAGQTITVTREEVLYLTANFPVVGGEEVTCNWEASLGRIRETELCIAIYVAPDVPGEGFVTVIIVVKPSGLKATGSIKIEVL